MLAPFLHVITDAVRRDTTERRVVGLFMNDEKERIWKETVVSKQRHYPGIFLEGPNETTKHSRRVGVTTKIRTQHFANANLNRYGSTNQLGI
jgi:hypothetical protein